MFEIFFRVVDVFSLFGGRGFFSVFRVIGVVVSWSLKNFLIEGRDLVLSGVLRVVSLVRFACRLGSGRRGRVL